MGITLYTLIVFLYIDFLHSQIKLEITLLNANLKPTHNTSQTPNQTTNQTPNPTSSQTPSLAACVMFRIWPGDSFGMSQEHVRQWVRYMRERPGITHITGYCNNNCVEVDYFDEFHIWPEKDYATAQRNANNHCIIANHNSWLLICDIDEYPFMPKDTAPGFLRRYVETTQASQILLRSMFFGQSGKHVEPNQTLFEAYTFRMPNAEDASTRTKPLFRVDRMDSQLYQPNIVHAMNMPNTIVADPETLRLNHYWGIRLDKPISELYYDNSMSLAVGLL